MTSRKLVFVLPLVAALFVTGCRSTSNRTSYCSQPAVVPAPCPAPVAACPTPCAPSVAVPPPPAGFVR